LVRREDAPAIGAEVERPKRLLEHAERARLVGGFRPVGVVPPWWHSDGDDPAGTAGPAQLRHRHEGMAERRDAGGVEAVVDPDVPGAGRADRPIAAVPRDPDTRRDAADPP